MTLELYKLVDSATGGAEPAVPYWLAASLQPVMVSLGSIYKFIASECRSVDGKPVKTTQRLLAVVSFCASFGVFLFVVWSILERFIDEKCPPGNAADRCPITDSHKKWDRDAVYLLTLIWVFYPAVTLSAAYVLRNEDGLGSGGLSQYVSTSKDVAFGSLDVFAKAGLALYAAMRSTWL